MYKKRLRIIARLSSEINIDSSNMIGTSLQYQWIFHLQNKTVTKMMTQSRYGMTNADEFEEKNVPYVSTSGRRKAIHRDLITNFKDVLIYSDIFESFQLFLLWENRNCLATMTTTHVFVRAKSTRRGWIYSNICWAKSPGLSFTQDNMWKEYTNPMKPVRCDARCAAPISENFYCNLSA